MDAEKHQLFTDRFVRNQQRVYRYLVSLVPNRADAEELFQQTSLTLWEAWERYDPALAFFPWACGIAHHHVLNFRRKRHASCDAIGRVANGFGMGTPREVASAASPNVPTDYRVRKPRELAEASWFK